MMSLMYSYEYISIFVCLNSFGFKFIYTLRVSEWDIERRRVAHLRRTHNEEEVLLKFDILNPI